MANSLTRWFDNRSLSPFRDFSGAQESFDRLFNDFMNTSMKMTNEIDTFSFSPSSEILEDEGKYTMKFDLPGIAKDQIKVETDGNQLTVRAERKEERKSESKKRYLSELRYGSYIRTFTMPAPVDEKKVDAHFENGVLTLTVPKAESGKSKQIAIH